MNKSKKTCKKEKSNLPKKKNNFRNKKKKELPNRKNNLKSFNRKCPKGLDLPELRNHQNHLMKMTTLKNLKVTT